ncbi:MAG TPA: TRAP transporter substrate-binding protein DctP [Alphaproteobacteria bacterium]|jgi:TRAP-type C4-dicarboxylate transport system substrate-binding protein
MTKLYRALLGSAAAFCLAAGAAGAQEVKLTALNFLPNNSSFGIPFADWVEDANKAGKGIVQITIRPAGSINPFQMGNAVKTGVVDMAALPPTFYQNLLPIGDALKLTKKTAVEMRKNGTWALMNKLHNEKVNAQLLDLSGFSVKFHTYLRDKKIDTPSLKGMKMRTTPVYRAFFLALGADVVLMPPADVFIALERGTVDGYGWPSWDIKTPGWDKHTKYRIDPGFYAVANATIMNLDKWKSLTPKQRDFIEKHALKFEAEFDKRYAPKTEAYFKEQKDSGIQVIEFKGKDAETYVKLAYDSAWEEFMKLDPVNAPALRKLISD